MTLSLDLTNSSSKFGTLTTFHSEVLKVRESTKNDFNWKGNISQTTPVKESKFSRTFSLNFTNCSSKFVILFFFCSKMLKVRKIVKNDLKWRANISKSAAGKASKFWVRLNDGLNNSFSRFGTLTTFCSERFKVRKSDTKLWENVAKFKPKDPSCSSSWDINPWIQKKTFNLIWIQDWIGKFQKFITQGFWKTGEKRLIFVFKLTSR